MLALWERGSLGLHGSIVGYWRDLAEADPMLPGARICVHLMLGDAEVLAASEPLTSTSSTDGTVYQYLPLLVEEPAFSSEITMGSRQPAVRSMSVNLLNLGLPLSDMLASGKPLAGVGEVSLQVDGQDHDLRLVLIRGEVLGGVRFRREGEEVRLSISDPRETRSGFVPPYLIDLVGWPLAKESAIGTRVPRAYNGWDDIPCPWVKYEYIMPKTYHQFAVCDTPADLTITQVRLNGEIIAGSDPNFPWTEQIVRNARGQLVLVVDFQDSTQAWPDNTTIHASVGPRSGVATVGVLGIIADLLRRYTGIGPAALRPDLFASAMVRLGNTTPKMLVNSSGGQTVSVTEIIGHLLDGWPALHLAYEAGGIGPVLFDRRIEQAGSGVEFDLEGGVFPLLDRFGIEELPKEQIQNTVEVRYQYTTLDNRFEAIVTRDPNSNARCRLSADLTGGPRPSAPIELPYVSTDHDAVGAADWQIEHNAFQGYVMEWVCPPWALTRFRRGMVGLYTDPDIPALTRVVAIITRVVYQRGQVVLGLITWTR